MRGDMKEGEAYQRHPIGTVLMHKTRDGGTIRIVVASGQSRRSMRPRPAGDRVTYRWGGVSCHYPNPPNAFNAIFRR